MRTSGIRKLLGQEFSVVTMKADGDCFYSAISKVILVDNAALRNVVSQYFDDDKFNFYKCISEASIPGYDWLLGCKNLKDAKKKLILKGVIWADEFAIKTICNHFSLIILIFNEEGKDNSRFTCFKPDDKSEKAVVLLHRTKREHFNLISMNGCVTGITIENISSNVKQLWGLNFDLNSDSDLNPEMRKKCRRAY